MSENKSFHNFAHPSLANLQITVEPESTGTLFVFSFDGDGVPDRILDDADEYVYVPEEADSFFGTYEDEVYDELEQLIENEAAQIDLSEEAVKNKILEMLESMDDTNFSDKLDEVSFSIVRLFYNAAE